MVNGILTWPGDARDWNVHGTSYCNTHFEEWDLLADRCEYFCGPVGRAVWQRRREQKLANLIWEYIRLGFDVVLVGHSNGGDVAIGALERLRWPRIKELHLFSAATEADFRHNGLNRSVERGYIRDVFVYVGGRDIWLSLARWPVGELLGYDGQWHWENLFSLKGALGYAGPLNVSLAAEPRVHIYLVPQFGHSAWWSGENFGLTMEWIAARNGVLNKYLCRPKSRRRLSHEAS